MGLFGDLFKKKDKPQKISLGDIEFEINSEGLLFGEIGIKKFLKGDYSGAVSDFSAAINAQPTNENLYAMRGTAYEGLGNSIKAEEDFIKTLELGPDNFVAAYRLGMIHYRRKDLVSAINLLKVSYENAADFNHEHLGMGRNNIFFVAKERIAGNLGSFLIQLKKYEESFEYLDVALKIDPNYSYPYLAKGLAYAEMGKPKEGIHFLSKAKELGNQRAAEFLPMVIKLAKQSN